MATNTWFGPRNRHRVRLLRGPNCLFVAINHQEISVPQIRPFCFAYTNSINIKADATIRSISKKYNSSLPGPLQGTSSSFAMQTRYQDARSSGAPSLSCLQSGQYCMNPPPLFSLPALLCPPAHFPRAPSATLSRHTLSEQGTADDTTAVVCEWHAWEQTPATVPGI